MIVAACTKFSGVLPVSSCHPAADVELDPEIYKYDDDYFLSWLRCTVCKRRFSMLWKVGEE